MDRSPNPPASRVNPASREVDSPLLARSRRLAPEAPPGSALSDLLAGLPVDEIASRRGLPRATVAGVRSFYDLIEARPRACDGTSCRFSGPAVTPPETAGRVRCLGHCYAAPAFVDGDLVVDAGVSATIPRRCLAPEPVVLRGLLGTPVDPFEDYRLPGGDAILEAVAAARIRGRGGALFPTAAKWRAARDAAEGERFVVANGDEGDPGSFVDRLLLEERPHAVLAGLQACARAIRARRAFVYVRAEYPRARASVRAAITEARARGLLDPDFRVEVVSGAGSYVCGEETALLRSIEGRRGEPAVKPPYPTTHGLHGRPTVVQNVETLAMIPWAVREARPSGTKVVCLSGALRWTGAVEVPLGMPLRRVLEEAGGGPPPDRFWNMAVIGGPMGRVLVESRFDTPLSWEALPGMGHAGIVVLDQRVTPRALAEHLFEFARTESCGQCTPCRAGTARLGAMRDRAGLERLLETIEVGSLCGFGQGVPRPIRDLLESFGDEVLP